jgi:protein-S-isoprenylcysteine O-methyltransferase Ste14
MPVNYLPVAAIMAVGLMAVWRIVALSCRGVRAIVIDRQRTPGEQFFEAATLALLVFWVYLIVDYADARGSRWLPPWLESTILDVASTKILGAALLVAGVVLYAAAVVGMGASWRMGIDREAHQAGAERPTATLVTTGIFARSRNPIYLSYDLLFLGSFLIHGRVVLLLMTVALAVVFHIQILREERFLAAAYGDRFADYRRRVRRYV